jgi:hypothetical protein
MPQAGRQIATYQTGQVEAANNERGRMISGIGEMLMQESDRLAAVQAEDGLNKIKQARLDLHMGDSGFGKLRGADVTNRPILKEYPEQFQSQIDGIVNGLPNSLAKQKLTQAAQSEMLGFKSDILRHSMAESDKHELSVSNATLAMAGQTAGMNWNDPAKVQEQFDIGNGRIDKLSARLGHDLVETQMMKEKFAASLHEGVLQAAIANQDIGYAEKYFDQHAKSLSTSDQVRYSKFLGTERAKVDATQGAQEVIAQVVSAAYPGDSDRVLAITAQAESGNSDFDKNGAPMTSKAGAKYRMQTMPATAADPGYGIKPAKDDSPAEYNRVGTEYMQALLRENKGDTRKAWAAYNAGPGRFQAAQEFAQLLQKHNGDVEAAKTESMAFGSKPLKKFNMQMAGAAQALPIEQRGDWLALMPDETRNYVAKNQQAYESGGGAQGLPSLMEIKTRVAENLKGKSAETIALAQTKAEAQLNDWRADRNQKQESALNEIMRGVEAGTIRDASDIPGNVNAFLDYKDRHSIQSYIKSASRTSDSALELSPTATAFYYELLTDPVALKQASIPKLMEMSGQIGQKRVNDLLQKRAVYLNQPEKEVAASVDSDQFKAAAAVWGFNPKSEAHKAQLIQARDRIETQVNQEQSDSGKTLTRERKGQIIDMNLSRLPVEEKGMLWGTNINERRGFEVQSGADVRIPDSYRKAARASGLQFSEQQLLAAYVADQKKAARK